MRLFKHRAGFSLIDVLIGAAILAMVSLVAVAHLNSGWRQAEINRDRLFAYERAQSIADELRAFAEASEVTQAAELDQWDDGTGFSFPLTIQTKPAPLNNQFVDPDAPVSGNYTNGGVWRYARKITVRHFPGIDTRDLRIVTVRIYKHDPSDAPGPELATISTVIRTTADATPPTQVFDVYMLALENVPGWWVYMDTIKPFIEASLSDLATRNPGLEFRTHWITKLGYGRDREYTPYFNEAVPSTDPIDYTYFYPGRMPTGEAALRYYVADNVAGRISVDGVVRNTYDATANPQPYALADQFNHCVRYPEAEKIFADRVAAGTDDPEAPTWQILLERMNANPAEYRNAILVNLHGELLPMPPLRNYSDAAVDPERLPNVRVVTHPEQIHFTRRTTSTPPSDDVKLRVYSYKYDANVGAEQLNEPIILEIPGLDLTSAVNWGGVGTRSLTIRRVSGGLDLNPVDGTRDPYVDPTTFPGLAPVVLDEGNYLPAYPGEMYARVKFQPAVSGRPMATVIELHNSPLTARVEGSSGLPALFRLYGMEYIPCSTEAANDFSDNLFEPGIRTKNTARWLITIPADQLGSIDRQVEVVTRIGFGDGGDTASDSGAFSTGVMYPPAARVQPQNISKTYCWWTLSSDDVPFTERYQYQGDPRHCPYVDLKDSGGPFANGYNWFFDDFEAGTDDAMHLWPGFRADRIKNDGTVDNDGWEERYELDIPRLFQLLRGGLTESQALWTTLTGFSYYYVGVGNEIGYDSANDFPNSIPVSGLPFGATGTGHEQSITDDVASYGGGIKYVRSNTGGTYWWGMPWLGELCPDDRYATHWKVLRHEYSDTLPLPSPLPRSRGNLESGTGIANYSRVPRDAINQRLPFATELRPAQRRTSSEGCTSLFNIGSASSTFHHQFTNGQNGDLTSAGSEIATDFHFPLPFTAGISRPFRLATDFDGGVGDEFAFTTDYPRFSATLRTTYYDHQTSPSVGSGLVELGQTSNPRKGFVLVSGLDKTVESGSGFIARYGMLSLLHGFMSAGDPALPNPISLPPRLVIQSPTAVTELLDPSNITITWRTDWLRWEGAKYTAAFPSTYSASETDLEYVLMYSTDNGDTWLHMADDSPATPGVLPSASLLRKADANDPGDESFLWNTPGALFPEGSYRIRIEAYRQAARLHFSYHEEKLFIDR